MTSNCIKEEPFRQVNGTLAVNFPYFAKNS